MSEVKVTGLREFRRGLKQLDGSLPKGVRTAGNKAAEIVVAAAKPRVPIGPGRGGHASSSIRKASTQSAVRVSEGSARFPYLPWLDFGGTINKHTANPTTRSFIKKGRYIWAAFDEHKDQVLDTYQDELKNLARSAGLDPR
ncbi:hypothetical protein GCM10010472_10860 [Pseudonocardia halophobica]|uniref:HK97 gp10 family phage protein n=1 Tax=Pseudonocardia halophobica TaxID=29401 RepID=A0A9W6L5K2_9PSEU|nr:hypothetical protein [Pseudonocardia halophobica]GLL13473.1 hypothetical protein GCM10017577_46170 [Pseudonocardia halophobica]